MKKQLKSYSICFLKINRKNGEKIVSVCLEHTKLYMCTYIRYTLTGGRQLTDIYHVVVGFILPVLQKMTK